MFSVWRYPLSSLDKAGFRREFYMFTLVWLTEVGNFLLAWELLRIEAMGLHVMRSIKGHLPTAFTCQE
jgi:hypothetical protein